MVERAPRAPLTAHLAAALVLAALAALVYAPLLRPGEIPYAPYSDVVAYHIAIKDVLARGLAAGSLPLWRADEMLGTPALTQPQSLFLHPLQFLFWVLPPLEAFGPTYVLELWIGALGMYALARGLGRSFLASLLAGVAQLVCFKLIIVVYAGWSSILPMLVMLPWVAAALIRAAVVPDLRSTLLLALGLAVSISGSTPQTLYYLFLVLGFYPLAVAYRLGRARLLGHALRVGVSWSSAVLLAVVTTAYLWIPLVSDMPLLGRSAGDYRFFLSSHGLTLRHLLTGFEPHALGTPLDGSYPGDELWEDVAYFGLIPLLAALGVLVTTFRRAGVDRYLSLAFLGTLVLAIDSPILRAAYAFLPGFSTFRCPGRMLFLTAVLGIALASRGFDALLDFLEQKRPGRARLFGALGLGLVMVLEALTHARAYLGTVESAQVIAPADHPVRALPTADRLRLAVVGRSAFNYAWASEIGLDVVNGYDPYHYAIYKRMMALVDHGAPLAKAQLGNWIDLKRIARPDLLRALSVGFVVSLNPLEGEDFELIGVHPETPSFSFYLGFVPRNLYLYRMIEPQARVRFARGIRPVASIEVMERRLAEEKLEGQVYVLEKARLPELGSADPGDGLEVTRHAPGRVEFTTHTTNPSWVVLAEGYHPGWHAQVDDAATSVEQVNLALMGVPVPAGNHRVVVWFEPPRWALAWKLSAAACVFWLVLGVWALWRPRTRPGS